LTFDDIKYSKVFNLYIHSSITKIYFIQPQLSLKYMCWHGKLHALCFESVHSFQDEELI